MSTQEAQQRFLERVRACTVVALKNFAEAGGSVSDILQIACFRMGERSSTIFHVEGSVSFMSRWDTIVGKNVSECLRMTEAVHDGIWKMDRHDLAKQLSNGIVTALEMSEVDLEVEWNGQIFTRKGARLLDERLVNDPLSWLREAKQENVVKPFEKGLRHWMEAHKSRERCGDVVTDMYESLEALAKIVTNGDRELAANRERFASKIQMPEHYNRMLKEYIDFGCKYRHAAGLERPRTYPTLNETESFIYLTGVFMRFALQATRG